MEADDDVLLQEVADRPWADWGRANKLSSVVKRALKLCINKQRVLNGKKPVHQVSSPAKPLSNLCSTAIMSPAATVKDSTLLRLKKCIVVIMFAIRLVAWPPCNFHAHCQPVIAPTAAAPVSANSNLKKLPGLLVAHEPIYSEKICRNVCC